MILGLSALFGLDGAMTITLLPKSVTSAMAIALSETGGGIVALTAAAVIVTGVFGNMAGPFLCRIFKLSDPIAQGVAYGTAAHVIGTARARQHSEVAGAVSSLSLVIAGLMTALLFPLLLTFL
jgi:putative effector of murein hydrolase